MELIEKQIKKFKEKVYLSQQTYSAAICKECMKSISKICNKPISSKSGLIGFIRTYYMDLKSRDMIVYARWYLETLDYLKELKVNFVNRIYEAILQQKYSRGSSNGSRNNPFVIKMKHLLDTLDIILDGEKLDDELFSKESELNISMSELPQQTRQFVRLMPDVFCKLDELASISTAWLQEKDEIMTPDSISPDCMDKTEADRQLVSLCSEIQVMEKELESELAELNALLEREERVNVIKNENHSLEVKINALKDKILQTKNQINDIEELMKTSEGNKKFLLQLNHEKKSKILQLNDLQEKCKILLYQKEITSEDLSIELEMKPSLIRLTNILQDKCIRLETSLEDRKLERQKLEMAIKSPAV